MTASYDLSGKTAVVTGGAAGIGSAVADLLTRSGARVWILDKEPVMRSAARSLVVDVTQPNEVVDAIAHIVAAESTIDILVNNAGYLGKLHAFHEHDREDCQRIIAVNLLGMLELARTVLPHMLSRGSGCIVNMASLAGKEGLPRLAVYSAASGGILAFTKALGREVAGTGVVVNCVAPGPIDTDMIRNLGADAVAAMVNDSPLKRLGHAGEVAQMVAWLCCEASGFNTGAVFDMSGGRARY